MRRWIATEGKYGEPPEDWALFKAAKYCNCKPWELLEQPVWWKLTALNYMSAEAEGQEMLDARRNKR